MAALRRVVLWASLPLRLRDAAVAAPVARVLRHARPLAHHRLPRRAYLAAGVARVAPRPPCAPACELQLVADDVAAAQRPRRRHATWRALVHDPRPRRVAADAASSPGHLRHSLQRPDVGDAEAWRLLPRLRLPACGPRGADAEAAQHPHHRRHRAPCDAALGAGGAPPDHRHHPRDVFSEFSVRLPSSQSSSPGLSESRIARDLGSHGQRTGGQRTGGVSAPCSGASSRALPAQSRSSTPLKNCSHNDLAATTMSMGSRLPVSYSRQWPIATGFSGRRDGRRTDLKPQGRLTLLSSAATWRWGARSAHMGLGGAGQAARRSVLDRDDDVEDVADLLG